MNSPRYTPRAGFAHPSHLADITRLLGDQASPPARPTDTPRPLGDQAISRPAAVVEQGAAERFAERVAQHQRRLPRAEAVLKAASEQPDLSRAAWREQHAAANTLAALCKQVARHA